MSECIICKAPAVEKITAFENFTFWRCPKCRLSFLAPQPPADYLNTFYQKYLPKRASDVQDWYQMMKGVFQRAKTVIQRNFSSPGHLLDVGCGFGQFVEMMRDCGWKVSGIDISQTAFQHCVQQGIEIFLGDFLNLEEVGKFEAITMFYFLEHHPQPLECLSKAYRLLNKNGLLFIRWPNTTPLFKIVSSFSENAVELFQFPAHLYDFSPKGMEMLLRKAGFSKIRHLVGGHTQPADAKGRFVNAVSSWLAEFFSFFSAGRLILPGVSRTTVAYKL